MAGEYSSHVPNDSNQTHQYCMVPEPVIEEAPFRDIEGSRSHRYYDIGPRRVLGCSWSYLPTFCILVDNDSRSKLWNLFGTPIETLTAYSG